MIREITFTLNGEERKVAVEPNDLLLDVLRDKLGIKSPKYGCGRGDCGTCTIVFNGTTARSCIMLAVEADGQTIETLEGLGRDGLTTLQEEFIARNSFQCGYCAPGMILAATELLENNAAPSDEEIKEAIAGNLCRCTGYTAIIEAIKAAAEKLSAKAS